MGGLYAAVGDGSGTPRGRRGVRHRVRRAMAGMAARGHGPNEWAWNCLVNAHCEAGDLASAEGVLPEMRDAVRSPANFICI